MLKSWQVSLGFPTIFDTLQTEPEDLAVWPCCQTLPTDFYIIMVWRPKMLWRILRNMLRKMFVFLSLPFPQRCCLLLCVFLVLMYLLRKMGLILFEWIVSVIKLSSLWYFTLENTLTFRKEGYNWVPYLSLWGQQLRDYSYFIRKM